MRETKHIADFKCKDALGELLTSSKKINEYNAWFQQQLSDSKYSVYHNRIRLLHVTTGPAQLCVYNAATHYRVKRMQPDFLAILNQHQDLKQICQLEITLVQRDVI